MPAPLARKENLNPPSHSPQGKPGRAGSPHAAKNGGSPHKRGKSPPCAIPRGRSKILLLTGAGLLMEAVTKGSGLQVILGSELY